MEHLKPRYYIKTFWEYRDGYTYPQPVERLNGKSYYEWSEDSFERLNWGKIYKESYNYNQALDSILYNSEFWRDEKAKQKALETVLKFINKGKSGTGSSITPLFPFEIELLNNGFKMMSFCELNALIPSLTIVAEKINGDEIVNPKGIRYNRWYRRGEDEDVYIGFGFGDTNFYFELSRFPGEVYQVNNDLTMFKEAINGQLENINNFRKNENK